MGLPLVRSLFLAGPEVGDSAQTDVAGEGAAEVESPDNCEHEGHQRDNSEDFGETQ